jgi:6-phosphogluconolactonase
VSAREVVVLPDAEVLAQSVAARLLIRLLDVQSVRRPAHLVVTGGTVGIGILAAAATSPLRGVVDWSGVHVWWGDERFLPTGHPDRNETQARGALIDALGDELPAENVHPMPAADAPGIGSPEDSAAAYALELAKFAEAVDAAPTSSGALAETALYPDTASHAAFGDHASMAAFGDRAARAAFDESAAAATAAAGHAPDGVPAFDVLLLGMGPDGHIASLFPGHPELEVSDTSTVGVHASPKPPPERVSLTLSAIHAAREVWLVAAGPEKADALASALDGAPVATTPAAAAVGRDRTLWLIDAAAASPGR